LCSYNINFAAFHVDKHAVSCEVSQVYFGHCDVFLDDLDS